MRNFIDRTSNVALSLGAGLSAFVLTLGAFLLLRDVNEQIVASLGIGLFGLLVVWVATQKPNSGQARAMSALIERLLAVKSGDLSSPAPQAVRAEMPALASAVDGLFEQVRSNLDSVNAMALYDPVTSLPNRVHFRRESERILEETDGSGPLALLFIDLDGFKEVNDNLGHAKGDQVLNAVADRIRAAIKTEAQPHELSAPLIARLAGDEFTVLLPLSGGREEGERIARAVLAAISEPVRLRPQRVHIAASIGVALHPDHGRDLTTLMKAADTAMYHAKASGRARVCTYGGDIAAAQGERVRLEKGLRRAMLKNELDLVFRPQLCLRTGDISAVEAILRWVRPGEPALLQDSFMALAEDSSLILDIGDWLTDAAIDTAARWREEGLSQRLSFGITARQLENPDFFPRLKEDLAESGLPLEMIEIEFGEAAAMRCGERVVAELAALRHQGLWVTLGRFGAGQSSLARLRSLPLDRIRLDRCLGHEIDTSPAAQKIAAALIQFIHGIGCEAVADGADRKSQVDVLRALGCDFVQGEAIMKVMDEAELRSLLGVAPAARIA